MKVSGLYKSDVDLLAGESSKTLFQRFNPRVSEDYIHIAIRLWSSSSESTESKIEKSAI